MCGSGQHVDGGTTIAHRLPYNSAPPPYLSQIPLHHYHGSRAVIIPRRGLHLRLFSKSFAVEQRLELWNLSLPKPTDIYNAYYVNHASQQGFHDGCPYNLYSAFRYRPGYHGQIDRLVHEVRSSSLEELLSMVMFIVKPLPLAVIRMLRLLDRCSEQCLKQVGTCNSSLKFCAEYVCIICSSRVWWKFSPVEK